MTKPNSFTSSFKLAPDLPSFDLSGFFPSHKNNDFLLREQNLNTSQQSESPKNLKFLMRSLDEMITSPFSLQSARNITQKNFYHGILRRDSPVESLYNTDRINYYGNENIPTDWACELDRSDWAREIDESILSMDSLIAKSTSNKESNRSNIFVSNSNVREEDTIKNETEDTASEIDDLPKKPFMSLPECFEEAETTDVFGLGTFDSVFITEQDIEKAKQKLTNEDFKTNETAATYLFEQLITLSDDFYKSSNDKSCILSTIQDISLCNNFTILAQATLHLTVTHLSFTLTTFPHFLFQSLTGIPTHLSFRLSDLSDVHIKEVELGKPRDTLLFTICEGRAFCASLFNEGVKKAEVRKLEGLMKVCVKRAKEKDDAVSAKDLESSIPKQISIPLLTPVSRSTLASSSTPASTSALTLPSPITSTSAPSSTLCSANLSLRAVAPVPTKSHFSYPRVLSLQQKSKPVTKYSSTTISREDNSFPSSTATPSGSLNPKGASNIFNRPKLTASTATHASTNGLTTRPSGRLNVVLNLSTKNDRSSLPVLSGANKGSMVPSVSKRVNKASGLGAKNNKLNVRTGKKGEITVEEEKTDHQILKEEMREWKDQSVKVCAAQTEEDEEFKIGLSSAIKKRDLAIASAHERYKTEVAGLREEFQQRMVKRRRIVRNEEKEVEISIKSIEQLCDEEIFMEICTNECQLCFAEEESREFLPCTHRLCASCYSRIQQITAEESHSVTIKCPWCRSDVVDVKNLGIT